MAAYAASKFGMEAVTDALRQELRPHNVSVSAIEPGFIRTPLVTGAFSAYEKNWDIMGDEVHNFPRLWNPNINSYFFRLKQCIRTASDLESEEQILFWVMPLNQCMVSLFFK